MSETAEQTSLITLEENTELAVLTDGVNDIVEHVRGKVCISNGDITKKKTRDEIKSNAYKVTKTKTFLAARIDDQIAQHQQKIAPITAVIDVLKTSKKKLNADLSQLAKDTKQVAVDYEDNLARIALEEAERAKAEKLAAEIEQYHEMALLMNDVRDREKAAEAEKIEAARLAREEELKAQAAKKAKREAEEKAEAEANRLKLEKAEAERKEKQATADKKAAEEARVAAEKQAKLDAEAAKKKAEEDAAAAAEKARKDEIARQEAEAKRIKEEADQREKDRAHAGAIMKAAKEAIMTMGGVNEGQAKLIVIAIKNHEIPNVSIGF